MQQVALEQGVNGHQPITVAPVLYVHGGPPVVNVVQAPKANEVGSQYNDVLWAILFIADLIFVVVIAAINYNNIQLTSSSKDVTGNKRESNALVVGLIGSFVASIVFGVGWMRVLGLPSVAPNIIRFSMIFYIVSLFLVMIVTFMTSPGSGIFMAIVFGISCFWLYSVRNRVAFASVMLEMATTVVKAYSNTLTVAFVIQLVSLCWGIVWLIAIMGSQASGVLMLLLVFSYYWFSAVFFNIIHVAVGGVAATWYYQSQTKDVASSSMKRACTTSLGSICLGSAIVAAIETIRWLAKSLRKENQFIACIVDCILGCIQSIAEFITQYAFAYVAIWGQPFCPAAKNTWQLLRSRGFDVVVNDDLTGLAFWASTLLGGIAGGAAGGFLAAALGGGEVIFVAIFLSFLIGLCTTGIMMSVLASCVTVFMVVWAEDPATLASKHPQFSQKLVEAVRKFYPTIRIQ